MKVPAAKLAGILDCLCLLLISMERALRLTITRAQGKVVKYQLAMPFLGVVTQAFWIQDSRSDWDTSVLLTTEFCTTVDYCILTILLLLGTRQTSASEIHGSSRRAPSTRRSWPEAPEGRA